MWKQGTDGVYTRQSESETPRAADLTGIPAGHVTMLFPVRGWYALPFRAASADESLYADLSAMHAERLGVRWDPMGGQLMDTFLVNSEGEAATLLAVVLKAPGEGELPPRSPKEFDLSARAFPVEGDAIAAWMEFGRWVFAFYKQGRLLYAQATSSESPDPDAGVLREIKLATSQLAIQGLTLRPQTVYVWSERSNAGSLAAGIAGAAVRTSARPDPKLPQPHSKLLPADVRAARKAAMAKQQQTLAIAAGVLVYLGIIGWLGYGLYQTKQKALATQKSADKIFSKAKRTEFELYRNSWNELDLVVNKSRWPVELMNRVVKAIPQTANGKLHFKKAEVTETDINLSGDAAELAPINGLNYNLKQPGYLLSDYTWSTPEAAPGQTGFSFNYTSTLKK